jgi:hypothetical protein
MVQILGVEALKTCIFHCPPHMLDSSVMEEDERRQVYHPRSNYLFPYSPLSSDCGGDCEAESRPEGTAALLRCILSAVVKSLSDKCLLHKYLLRSVLAVVSIVCSRTQATEFSFFFSIVAESIVQDIPTFLAHTTAL